jgi:hypothetical protein
LKHVADSITTRPSTRRIQNKIHELADAVLPPPAKGREQESIFCKVLHMGECQDRGFCVYSAPGKTVHDTTDKSQFYKNMMKIKKLFKMTSPPICAPEYVLTQEQKSQFRDCLLHGELLSITVFNETGREDTLISVVQFKSTPLGTWIYYLGTTNKKMSPAIFGTKGRFLTEGQIILQRWTSIGIVAGRAIVTMPCRLCSVFVCLHSP